MIKYAGAKNLKNKKGNPDNFKFNVVDDMSMGRIGSPAQFCDVRLIDWDEGNHSVQDKPFPRGEICVGGPIVALGYLKQNGPNKDDFFEEDGTRWFRTGDIGQVEGDGSFRLIGEKFGIIFIYSSKNYFLIKFSDRKKDFVKLSMGEYLSLGRVESILKTCPYIDNICIVGDSSKNFCVALIVPNEKMVKF